MRALLVKYIGGTLYLLSIQLLACACITIWAMMITFILLWVKGRHANFATEPSTTMGY